MAKLSWTVVARYERYKTRVWSAIDGLDSFLRISSLHIVKGMMLLLLDMSPKEAWSERGLQDPEPEDNNHQNFFRCWHLHTPYQISWQNYDSYIRKDIEHTRDVPQRNIDFQSASFSQERYVRLTVSKHLEVMKAQGVGREHWKAMANSVAIAPTITNASMIWLTVTKLATGERALR